MHQASQQGHTEVVDLLLRRGSVVDASDDEDNTALHLACIECHEGVVRLLLAAGASVTVEDDTGRSAMDWASEERHAAIRQILQQHIDTPAQAQQLLLEDSPSGAAGQAQEGARRGSKRAFRFRCNNPACASTEESLQRLLNKCGRCRGVRYCSDACRLVDWRSHKPVCHAPSLEGGEGTATAPARPVGPAATAVSGARGGAKRGGAGARRCGFPDCPHGDVSARDKCGACGQVRYCSRPCQLQHWPQHRPECQAARGMSVGAPLGP